MHRSIYNNLLGLKYMYDKIGVASYSFSKSFIKRSVTDDHIAKFCVDNGFKYLEVNNLFFHQKSFISKLQTFLDHGMIPIQLTVDGNNLFQAKESGRKKQFEKLKRWVDIAHEASIPCIRANMGHMLYVRKSDTVDNLDATFRPIFEYMDNAGIQFVFENHGGRSSDVNFQLQVKDRYPSPNMGYLLDFGNYKPKTDVYENILKLGSSILRVHAKVHKFDEQGESTELDFKKIITNLKQIGYGGYYTVEFEGLGDQYEGVLKTRALLNKYL